ncbi:class E sortase [Streptomyces sp. NRRL S-495]|uniref:class E sortase n=1 Tax=Streptomyces sp. NRRL S-495 TaxID=1609133 RepID=UPI0005F95FB7|nr:class E sortase [Streptomyces sp. NRRL S-495]KJY37805.1 membrane protein [Streptomyces sp. NRRL S-495]
MTQGTEPVAEEAARRRRGRGGWALAVLGVVGELLITLGLVLGLFVTYSLWWTDVLADRSASAASDQLRESWATGAPAAPPSGTPSAGPSAATGATGATAPSYAAGDGIGFLHVPAMGRDNQVMIRMGTDTATLAEGVAGVYEQPYRSAMPWDESGNFALAAHRDGHGAKFHELDAVGKGDAIVVETRDKWYVYRVDSTLPETSKYDTGIVAPVPKGSGYTGPGRYITLTTCTPVYTSRYRMAVWGSLVRVDDMDAARTPPAELRQR